MPYLRRDLIIICFVLQFVVATYGVLIGGFALTKFYGKRNTIEDPAKKL